MPRLDIFLVESGIFPSRQAAKRAIRHGHVTVNGQSAKPSTYVNGQEQIMIINDTFQFPVGYSKLKSLDHAIEGELVSTDMLALDIGSSAGGFAKYLLENGATVIGLEVSESFSKMLHKLTTQYPTFSFQIADAFITDPASICTEGDLDLLLIDVTTNPAGTLSLIDRFSTLLKKDGRLIASFKSKPSSDTISTLHNKVANLGFSDIKDIVLNPNIQEIHLAAVRQ